MESPVSKMEGFAEEIEKIKSELKHEINNWFFGELDVEDYVYIHVHDDSLYVEINSRLLEKATSRKYIDFNLCFEKLCGKSEISDLGFEEACILLVSENFQNALDSIMRRHGFEYVDVECDSVTCWHVYQKSLNKH